MNITVHIERLILDGLPVAHSQSSCLKASVEAELAHLLTEGALALDLHTPGMLPQITAGTIELQNGEGPEQLGKHIARALYRGVGQ